MTPQRRWQLKHPEKYKQSYTKTNARKKADGYTRNWNFKKKYNITLDQWSELFEKQGRKCAICEKAYDGNFNKWRVDHNHTTQKVRGILCHICNRIVLPTLKHYSSLCRKAELYLIVNS